MVPTSEMGMEMATTSVLRMLTRKTSSARMASTLPHMADEPTLLMARRMYSALFDVGRSSIWGMSRWISVISFRTRSATLTVFSPDCL